MLLALVAGERAVWGDGALASAVDWVVPISDDRVHVDPWVRCVELALLVAVAALAARRLRSALFAGLGAGATVAATELTKALVSRPVLDGRGDGSFPSGSASWTLAACGICVVLLDADRRAAVAGALVVLGVAVAVIWERWHYPTDVLGGWLLATACVAAARTLASEAEGGRRLLGQDAADGEGRRGAG